MISELIDFLSSRNFHSKNECLNKIDEEMDKNIKLFNNGELTYEEFHYLQRELIKIKTELGL